VRHPPVVSSSLDLAPAAEPSRPVVPDRPPRPRYRAARIASGDTVVLTAKAPILALTRPQSGVGLLDVQAVCSGAGLGLGCAYTFTDGRSSVLRHDGGTVSAPRDSRDPAIVARRQRFERITVDLRQIRRIARLIVFGYDNCGDPTDHRGTVVVTTFGGGRMELPFECSVSNSVAVFLSAYNVDGELVVRAESDNVPGTIRNACEAYGFERIAWLGDADAAG
jgi:hypothetical protein